MGVNGLWQFQGGDVIHVAGNMNTTTYVRDNTYRRFEGNLIAGNIKIFTTDTAGNVITDATNYEIEGYGFNYDSLPEDSVLTAIIVDDTHIKVEASGTAAMVGIPVFIIVRKKAS